MIQPYAQSKWWNQIGCYVLVATIQNVLGWVTTPVTTDPPTPSIISLSEQERLAIVIEQLRKCGEMLPMESTDHRISARRSLYQQLLCYLAYHLDRTEDPAFTTTVNAACDAQWDQWPKEAQYCFPCQN